MGLTLPTVGCVPLRDAQDGSLRSFERPKVTSSADPHDAETDLSDKIDAGILG